MSLYSHAGDPAFDKRPMNAGPAGADPQRLANRIFAGVCGWLILCVAGGAVLGQRESLVDHNSAIAGIHSADLVARTPM